MLRSGFGPWFFAVVFLFIGRLAVEFIRHRFLHRYTVIESKHDDDDVRLLGGENAPGGRSPVGRIALGLIFD